MGQAMVVKDLNSSDMSYFAAASPNSDRTQLGNGYRMVPGLQPTFGVAADISNGEQHEKEGRNVLPGDNLRMTRSSIVGGSPLAQDEVSDGIAAANKPAAAYTYDSELKAPALGAAKSYEPGSVDAAKSVEDLQSAAAVSSASSGQTTPPAPGEARRFGGAGGFGGGGGGGASAEGNQTAQPESGRKIIRHGEMSFEVDSFDSAFVQISKIAAEEGGFVSDTDSNKLDNGKMSGTVTVRVPPEHLDTLILKLRALGDLKGQKITSDDITREYTDLQSELRAAQAMEDRLLEIIKTSKGTVRELLAAEDQVGVWREKVEQVTGQINYDNNLVSLSTLQVTLTERDIRQAALASEQEMVDMGIETADVEKARDQAMAALDGVKARIIQAELKKLDAGQFQATIMADVSPDAAGPIIDQLRGLGRVARMNINRQQTLPQGTTAVPGLRVERLDTQLVISIYNLANVAARQTSSVSMACPDVETAYHAILSAVTDAGGRVVNSSLNRIKPEQADASLNFDVPREKAGALLAQVRERGEVMQLTVTENPDAENVTDAKQAFDLTLASAAAVAPRESAQITLMPGQSVAKAYQAMLAIVRKDGGNVTTAQLQEQPGGSDSATLAFDVGQQHQGEIEQAIVEAVGDSGRIISRTSSRSTDTEHTLDSKVGYCLTLASADALQPREVTARTIAVADVSGAYGRILAAAQQAGAKIAAANLDQSNPSSPSGQLDLIVTAVAKEKVESAIQDSGGGTISKSVARSADMNATTDEKSELRLTIQDLSDLPARQTTTMNVQVSDPESAMGDLQAAALAAGGRVVEQHLVKNDKYEGHLVVVVPLSKGADYVNQVRDSGTVQTVESTEDLSVPAADFAEAKLDVTLAAGSGIVGPDAGLWQGLKNGLSASVHGLAYSLELVTIGLCLILPWTGLGWVGWKIWRRFRGRVAGGA
jgi:hypothetical protein